MLTKLWCWLFGHKNYFISYDDFYRGHPNVGLCYKVPTNKCMRCDKPKEGLTVLQPEPFTAEELEFIRKCAEDESKD